MLYGVIGEHLSHSFSKEIHSYIGDYDYSVTEIAKPDLEAFIKAKNFSGINVTIPYKQAVIPFLDEISAEAKAIGAVNTIVNKKGRLYGYNTDFFGASALIKKTGVDLKGKNVLILGTGGTSLTLSAVAKSMGARRITHVSRHGKSDLNSDPVNYEAAPTLFPDTQVIINTTPVGMFPKNDSSPIDIKLFPNLCGVIDVIYNPLRSKLVQEAKSLGIAASGGLYMLAAQGIRAAELFFDKIFGEAVINKVYAAVKRDKTNMVLIGMPSSGKSTVGSIIANMTNRPFYDTDIIIQNNYGADISTIFSREGEKAFRELEKKAIGEVSPLSSSVIATGGGSVIDPENVDNLRQNGVLVFLDRPLELLTPTDDRPLAGNKERINRLYDERYKIYSDICDIKITADTASEETAKKVLEALKI